MGWEMRIFEVPSRRKAVGSRYIKHYHAPMTPYVRVMAHPDIPDDIKTALKEPQAELDPLTLKATIEQKLKDIFSSISVSPNVRQRL